MPTTEELLGIADLWIRSGLNPEVVGVLDEVKFDVLVGHILPGDRLIEDHLMEDYGVKRHVARSALSELERLGIVVKPPHRGAELRKLSEAEIDSLYTMRELLQAAALSQMKLPIGSNAVAKLEELEKKHSDALLCNDLSMAHRHNMSFHLNVYAACENGFLLKSILQHDWLSFAVSAYGFCEATKTSHSCSEHIGMIKDLRDGNRAKLSSLILAHMNRAKLVYETKFAAASSKLVRRRFARKSH